SLQVEARRRACPISAPDFGGEGRADPKAVAEAELVAGAIVLLDTGRRTPKDEPVFLGTLLVERDDDLPPDKDELDDLIQFGRKLAGVIEQSERVQLLQTTLDKQTEPLAILDASGRLRYANTAAAAQIDRSLPSGWQHPETMTPIGWGKEEADDSLRSHATNCARRSHWWGRRVVE